MANGDGETTGRRKGPVKADESVARKSTPKDSGAKQPPVKPARKKAPAKAASASGASETPEKEASAKRQAKKRAAASRVKRPAEGGTGAAAKRTTTAKEAEAQTKRYAKRADKYLNDAEKADRLLKDAQSKAKRNKGPLSESFDEIMSLVRLVRAYIKGEYREVPWESLTLAIGALLYFVSPIDLIPDFVPVAGYVDDAAVIGFVIKSIGNDLRQFREWEDERPADE